MAARLHGFVIGVVDDDPSILWSLEHLLESADYTVRSFASAAALLSSEDMQEIDCLISDIDMPGVDGFELLAQIEAVRPELPTFVITGYPERLKLLPPFVAAHPRLFTKPFHPEELLSAISAALASGKL